MNFGGWLLLTALFSLLFLVIQRAERKRRLLTAIIVLLMAGFVWSYGIYRISSACDLSWPVLCIMPLVKDHYHPIAVTTTFWSVGGALLLNFFYWAFFGRYNPAGSSDSITVYGMNDL